jgi:hypothetical protein
VSEVLTTAAAADFEAVTEMLRRVQDGLGMPGGSAQLTFDPTERNGQE